MARLKVDDYFLEDNVHRYLYGCTDLTLDNLKYKLLDVGKLVYWMYTQLMETKKRMEALETMFGVTYDEKTGEYHG